MNNVKHEVIYHHNGNIEWEAYCVNNILHRLDGPAIISYFDNGNIEYEEYYVNGVLHRLNGPAFICYYRNGNILFEQYCVNGKECTKEEIEEIKFNAQFIKDFEEVINI